MFHVEHMRKTLIIPIFFVFFGCNKPDPHPETLDPIFSDYNSELSAATSDLRAAEKELEGLKLETKKATPQTGQLGFSSSRMYEADKKVEKLRQMVQYWELKIESRQQEDRKQYLKAWADKKPWPDPQEYKDYLEQKQLRKAPLTWSVKKRMEEAGVGIPVKVPGSEHAGAAPAAEHGGGEKAAPPEHH